MHNESTPSDISSADVPSPRHIKAVRQCLLQLMNMAEAGNITSITAVCETPSGNPLITHTEADGNVFALYGYMMTNMLLRCAEIYTGRFRVIPPTGADEESEGNESAEG